MSHEVTFSRELREDIESSIEKVRSLDDAWLRDTILKVIERAEAAGSDYSLSAEDLPSRYELMGMDKADLAGEAADLIEQNFKGDILSIDPEGDFQIDLKSLTKEREIVEHQEKVEEYNGMMALAVAAGENTSFPGTLEYLRGGKGENGSPEKLIPNPCETPKGAFINVTPTGVSIDNAKGEHLSGLKEGFEEIGNKLPGLRKDALMSEPSKSREQDLESDMRIG